MNPKAFQLLACAILAVNSCAASPMQPGTLASTDILVSALQQQGATVTRAGTMPRSAYPFFSVAAQRIVVNESDVVVFEYECSSRADADASRISATGTPIGQSQISWMDTPNFFKRDRLMVLYVGHSADVLRPLEAVLGSRFAGGD